MKRSARRKKKKKASGAGKRAYPGKFRSPEFRFLKRRVAKLWRVAAAHQRQIENVEIHSDLMQRIIVMLALKKLKMRLSELRRFVRMAEKEAIAESEVLQLERLFGLPAKKPPHGDTHDKLK